MHPIINSKVLTKYNKFIPNQGNRKVYQRGRKHQFNQHEINKMFSEIHQTDAEGMPKLPPAYLQPRPMPNRSRQNRRHVKPSPNFLPNKAYPGTGVFTPIVNVYQQKKLHYPPHS
jgi:hypothetical protein